MINNDCWPGSGWDKCSGVPIWSASPLPQCFTKWDNCRCQKWVCTCCHPICICKPVCSCSSACRCQTSRPRCTCFATDRCDCLCPPSCPPCPPPCPPCPPPCSPQRCCSQRQNICLELPVSEGVRQIKSCRVNVVGARALQEGCNFCVETQFMVFLEIIDGCGCCRSFETCVAALCCGFPPQIICTLPCVEICGRVRTRAHRCGVSIFVPTIIRY